MNLADPGLTKPAQPAEAGYPASVAAALRSGDERMARIEMQLTEQRIALSINTATTQQNARTATENTLAIQAVHERTNEMVDVFMAMKGGFKVLGWIGQLAKWGAPLIGAYFALRQAGQSGGWWPFQ
jgi:hypothetical protein